MFARSGRPAGEIVREMPGGCSWCDRRAKTVSGAIFQAIEQAVNSNAVRLQSETGMNHRPLNGEEAQDCTAGHRCVEVSLIPGCRTMSWGGVGAGVFSCA